MSTLDDTRACAEHREKSEGSRDWCAIRVSGAELGQWNGDYVIKSFSERFENSCPYYERKEQDHGNLDPGIPYIEYDIMPPQLTDGRGWCMTQCREYQYAWMAYSGCSPDQRKWVYCAPACGSNACCIPSSGWRRLESAQDSIGSASSLLLSSSEGNFEHHLPPRPPLPPFPPQRPPSPANSGSSRTNVVAVVAWVIFVSIALGIVIGFRRQVRRLRRLAHAAMERQAKLWSEEKEAMELAIRALPTRRFVSGDEPRVPGAGTAAGEPAGAGSSAGVGSSSGDEPAATTTEVEIVAEDVAECAVCLESFAAGDLVRSLPCKHEFHVRRALHTSPKPQDINRRPSPSSDANVRS